MRAVLAALAGYAVWTALWLGGNAGLGAVFPEALAAFEDGGALDDPAYLGAALGLSLVCSFIAGRVAAALDQTRARTAVIVMIALLLATGIGVQASAWTRMPLWYHLAFLAGIAPVCLLGGRRGAAGA